MAIQIFSLEAFDTMQQCPKKQSLIFLPIDSLFFKNKKRKDNAIYGVMQCKAKW